MGRFEYFLIKQVSFKVRRLIPQMQTKRILFYSLWAGFGVLCYVMEFFVVYICLSGFVLIFANLRSEMKPGEISAYSVFNRGQRAIPGTATPADLAGAFGAALRPQEVDDVPADVDEDADSAAVAAPQLTHRDRQPNSPCYCGSGLKYKKCCGDPRIKQQLERERLRQLASALKHTTG